MAGFFNGLPRLAMYDGPRGIAVDPSGAIYVADTGNDAIRALFLNQSVTTIAGRFDVSGATNGVGTNALFWKPSGIAVGANGNLIVADSGNNLIRIISPHQAVSTLAGSTSWGTSDGVGTNARFSEPAGVAVDSAGNVYVADSMNYRIRLIFANLTVITLAGSSYGSANGIGSNAQFVSPTGVAIDNNSGLIYVADKWNGVRIISAANSSVVQVTPSGEFCIPAGVAVGPSGKVYVVEAGGCGAVRAILANQAVAFIAGGSSGLANGVGSNAKFNFPYGIAVDALENVLVADTSNHQIRIVSPSRSVATLSGGGFATRGSSDGVGSSALFSSPAFTAIDASGTMYVADSGNSLVRAILPNRSVTTLAGSAQVVGYADGIGTNAVFWGPTGVAIGPSGIVYVSEYTGNRLRLIFPNRSVATLAGSTTGASGCTDAIGTSALFKAPSGIVLNPLGTMLYVADSENHKVRAVFLNNRSVITIAGSVGCTVWGNDDGVGTTAFFFGPTGLAMDPDGILYVADSGNARVRVVFRNLSVVTLARPSNIGNLYGVAVSSSGTVYFSDRVNHRLYTIFSGSVELLAGFPSYFGGSVDGVGTNAHFNRPAGLSLDASGYLYVADSDSHKIRIVYPNLTSFAAACLPGSFLPSGSLACAPCPPGSHAPAAGAQACAPCAEGHYCPAGTSSWARLNCGRGNYCPLGSAAPLPCPALLPPGGGAWADTPPRAQGPAFMVETAGCLSQCFWGASAGAGAGLLSAC